MITSASQPKCFCVAVASRAGRAIIEWVPLYPISPGFTEPCLAVVAFAGGHAFVTNLAPINRALSGAWCRPGSLEQAIDADGGVWRFARRHIRSAIHLTGRVVKLPELSDEDAIGAIDKEGARLTTADADALLFGAYDLDHRIRQIRDAYEQAFARAPAG